MTAVMTARRNCWVFEGYFCRDGCPYKQRFGLLAKTDPNLRCALAIPPEDSVGADAQDTDRGQNVR